MRAAPMREGETMTAPGAPPPASPAVQIRPAVPVDCSFITGLSWRLDDGGLPPWHDRAKYHAFHQAGVDRTAATVVAIAAGGAVDRAVLLAEAAESGGPGAPLGVIHLRGDRGFLTGEARACIEVLAITREAAGRGVGRALMRAAEDWERGRGCRLIALDTAGVNAHACAFYRRCACEEEVVTYVKALVP